MECSGRLYHCCAPLLTATRELWDLTGGLCRNGAFGTSRRDESVFCPSAGAGGGQGDRSPPAPARGSAGHGSCLTIHWLGPGGRWPRWYGSSLLGKSERLGTRNERQYVSPGRRCLLSTSAADGTPSRGVSHIRNVAGSREARVVAPGF